MSADNYIGVMPRKEGGYLVFDGCMSILDEDCRYRGHMEQATQYPTREEALVAAHNQVLKEYIVEYGVIELPPVPDGYCGECYVCVHVRGITSSSLPMCAGCDPAKLTILVTRDDLDGGYIAEVDELRGCVTQGETIEETLTHLGDAIRGVLDAKGGES